MFFWNEKAASWQINIVTDIIIEAHLIYVLGVGRH